ncbi:hypothetical protein BC832DRAFT_553940 [Gaertneriomyces semiglobifer]|nr:hypothetical protein BC832DRAFT_553940 [Gaertneriomyces semiglobifer]
MAAVLPSPRHKIHSIVPSFTRPKTPSINWSAVHRTLTTGDGVGVLERKGWVLSRLAVVLSKGEAPGNVLKEIAQVIDELLETAHDPIIANGLGAVLNATEDLVATSTEVDGILELIRKLTCLVTQTEKGEQYAEESVDILYAVLGGPQITSPTTYHLIQLIPRILYNASGEATFKRGVGVLKHGRADPNADGDEEAARVKALDNWVAGLCDAGALKILVHLLKTAPEDARYCTDVARLLGRVATVESGTRALFTENALPVLMKHVPHTLSSVHAALQTPQASSLAQALLSADSVDLLMKCLENVDAAEVLLLATQVTQEEDWAELWCRRDVLWDLFIERWDVEGQEEWNGSIIRAFGELARDVSWWGWFAEGELMKLLTKHLKPMPSTLEPYRQRAIGQLQLTILQTFPALPLPSPAFNSHLLRFFQHLPSTARHMSPMLALLHRIARLPDGPRGLGEADAIPLLLDRVQEVSIHIANIQLLLSSLMEYKPSQHLFVIHAGVENVLDYLKYTSPDLHQQSQIHFATLDLCWSLCESEEFVDTFTDLGGIPCILHLLSTTTSMSIQSHALGVLLDLLEHSRTKVHVLEWRTNHEGAHDIGTLLTRLWCEAENHVAQGHNDVDEEWKAEWDGRWAATDDIRPKLYALASYFDFGRALPSLTVDQRETSIHIEHYLPVLHHQTYRALHRSLQKEGIFPVEHDAALLNAVWRVTQDREKDMHERCKKLREESHQVLEERERRFYMMMMEDNSRCRG